MPKLNRKSTPERCLPARLEAAASAANRARHISPFRWKRKALIPVCLLILTFAVGLTLSLPITKDTLISKVKAQSISAFPGAEGFGTSTPGGRGGRVIEVTNLNNSGSGSLRACIEASGPRTCVFRTGGIIELQSTLVITSPYITIAGQTAPGGGITLKNGPSNGGPLIWVKTHDVVLRYLTARPGPDGGESGNVDAVLIGNINGGTDNITVDHCSFSWATDEVVNTWYDAQDITLQWNVVSEALNCSTHYKGCHSKGVILGSDEGSGEISMHHNLLAHNDERNPLIKTDTVVDVVNNIIYNPGGAAAMLSDEYRTTPSANFVANYAIAGRDSGNHGYMYVVRAYLEGGIGFSFYVQGNIDPNRTQDNQDEALAVWPDSRQYITNTRYDAPLVTTTSAFEAYDQVLAGAGAIIGLDGQGNTYWRRDAVDQRIVNDVRNGTGGFIDDPSEVGGWPDLDPGTPYADSDHDGMADEWERTHFGNLSRGSASNSSSDYDGDGYTDLEEFLNGTNPTGDTPIPTPTPDSPTPTPTPSPTPSPSPPIEGQLISNLVVYDSGNVGDWSIRDNLQVNDQYYGDRDYLLTSVPGSLLGSEWIRTAADSKGYTGSPVATFTAAEDITVYLAHNDEITSKPSWLQSWTDTGENLTTLQLGEEITFSLYKQSFSQGGTVSLGPNGETDPTMYTVIVQPGSSNPYDLSGNGQVNAADVLILLQNWRNGSQGDFNSDGKIDSLDFGMLIANWTE